MADKKISQLPLIQTISGSTVVVPMVHDGTTIQIPIERLSLFTSQFSATTGSNTFIGNQTITGNATIGGTLVVAGKLTAQEFHTEITSASVIFESGSSIFGNSGDDTHTFTGSLLLNGVAVGTGELNAQTASQADVNLRISSTTGSINTTTASFDSIFQRISSTTGSINTTTASFDSVFLGISSFTGSLNSFTGSYATTGSNTFRGNQSITGSLSISAGEFNITTGSGNMTSSLIFDHTQNDGVTLQLRHNDRLSLADHTFNVNVWAAGVYTTFVRNGTPYSILNVEAFDDNKIYLYRDTRLYNKSLVIDNNLTVQRDVVIGTGSLDINNGEFSITSGSGELTSSLSFTHTTVDPITGNATLALRYRNNDVGPENNAWRFVADDGGVKLSYDQYATSNKLLFSVSSLGSNFDKLLIWRDARLFGKGLTVDDSLLVKGVITGSLLATNGVVSSSNQLFELNQQTGSQNSVNLGISTSTGSLIGITNGLMAFTASLDNTYATDAQLYQLYAETSSMKAEIGGIEAYTASLKGAAIVSSSQQITNYYKFAETASANTTFYGGLTVTDYSKFGKSGVAKALDIFGGVSITGSVTTQQNTIGGFIGNFYTQWDSFGSQGGDGAASVGYFVGAQNDDRKLRLTSDSDIQLNHGINKKIQITKNSISNARVELTGSLLATGSSAIVGNLEVTLGGITGSILATNGVVSSSNQIFVNGTIISDNTSQKILATNSNILYLYSGTSGIYINNQANDTTIAKFTNAGELTIGGAGNDQNLVFGGTNSSIYWGVGGPARMYYNVGDIRISSNGATDVLNVKNIGGILVSGGITGSIMATNGVVSGSQQIAEYNRFAQTSSANTFYDTQTISGSLRVNGPLRGNIISGGLDVNGGITGSVRGNLDGVAAYASTIAVANSTTTTDTSLFPIFSLSPVLGSYTNLYSHASSSFFYNGVTRRLHMEGFVVSGSNNTVEISGSLIITGSSIITGSFLVSGSTTQIGNNTLTGNTVLSGSILVSGSSDFKNSEFRVTGSSFFTGSHTITGNSIFSGSVNIASGSSYYRAGNKLFNYGQWASLETQSGSANTAYAVKLGSTTNGSEGIYIANDGSGFPTRITAENTGLYNVQFSFQLNTTATETCDFSVWYAMTGSNVANSNTDFSIDKTAGGGNGVAALNFLTHITANDYVEIYWSKSTANGQLVYKAPQSTPTRPATPSAIVTITQVA